MSTDKLLFRPHSMGDIMSGVKKGWDVEHSLTCKRSLIKICREIRYNRYYNHSNKYTEKGILMENDGITLYCRVKGIFLQKNTQRVTNDYFSGEYDLKNGRNTIDIKCSWSLETFPHAAVDVVDTDYEYQGHGYLDLVDGDEHTVAHCLVNAPGSLILREKEKLWYRLSCPNDSDAEYVKGKQQIERNMIFDMKQFISDNPGFDFDTKHWEYDIPMDERLVDFTIKRNQAIIDGMHCRIDDCRQWIDVKKLLQAA